MAHLSRTQQERLGELLRRFWSMDDTADALTTEEYEEMILLIIEELRDEQESDRDFMPLGRRGRVMAFSNSEIGCCVEDLEDLL